MYKILNTCEIHNLATGHTAKCQHIQDGGKVYWYGSFTDAEGLCMFEAETIEDLEEEFKASLLDWLEWGAE